MKVIKRYLSKGSCALLCLVILLSALSLNSFATEETHKTVRVAYVIASGYQEGGEGEYKTGYGYEYLQRIAEVTG